MDLSEKDIELLAASELFDADWYIRSYPDVAAIGLSPVEHYLRYGTLLQRDPGPRFSTAEYLAVNPDVAAAKSNALLHYLRSGRSEGRRLRADASSGAQVQTLGATGARRGAFDRLSATSLAGWAVDKTKPGEPVELTIEVDGVHVMNIRTSNVRSDVTAKGMNGKTAGFNVEFPAGLFATGTKIAVRFASDGAQLAHSPREVSNAAAASLSRRSSFLEASRVDAVRPVTVIVAIYNAHDAVAECLAALATNLPQSADVLMMDDCSTDPEIAALLSEYASRPGFRVFRNEINIGYTRSINRAIGMCEGRDVVLLNSDTVVTPRWLHNLRYCAYESSSVATVTALSDNAGAFSVPEIGQANAIPANLGAENFALAAVHAGRGRRIEVPTGNGFCLYIRRAALDAIGNFDEVKFPRGYGEENDFSMRALRAGWKNIVCDKALVFHKRSQSFQGEKQKLMEAGSQQVNSDYPEYRSMIRRFHDLEFSMVRQRVRAALKVAESALPLPRVLFVISTQTGGTPQTNRDLMLAMRGHFEGFLLRCDSSAVVLSRLVGSELQQVEVHALSENITPVLHRSDEYDQIVLDILYRYSIDLLHIRHIAWHGMGLVDSARAMEIPVIYSLHDFYSICPSLNLLDDRLRHCGGTCTQGEGRCEPNLWSQSSLPPLKHRFVHRWREMFGQFIDKCDQLITTAPSAAATITKVYGHAGGKLVVIPHGRDFSKMNRLAGHRDASGRIRVLVPGNISVSKGARFISEISRLDSEGRLEFHFLGDTAAELAEIGVHHGRYERDRFAEKVAGIAPHLGVVLSIWPETYCHTLTEMWSCGIPVFAIDLGAVGDRIREANAGWLVPQATSASEVLSKLVRAVDDSAEYEKCLHATWRWQETEGIWNDTATMAAEYRAIYRRLLGRSTGIGCLRVGLLGEGFSSDAAKSTGALDIRLVSVPWLLAGGASKLDLVIVSTSGVQPEFDEEVIGSLALARKPFILVADEFKGSSGSNHRERVLRLAATAESVLTNDSGLAEELRRVAKRVEIALSMGEGFAWSSLRRAIERRFLNEIAA